MLIQITNGEKMRCKIGIGEKGRVMENRIYFEIIERISEQVKVYMEQYHIKHENSNEEKIENGSKNNNGNEKVILDFLDNRDRWVTQKKRNVIVSESLEKRLEKADWEKIKEDFEYMKQIFEQGNDVNYHLSKGIFNSTSRDYLLNALNIKHVHLSQKEAYSKSGMSQNRSKYLLFCIIDEDNVYCLDVIEHPETDEFFCYNLVKIAYESGWIEKLGLCLVEGNYVGGSLNFEVTNDKDLTTLYTDCKINSPFEFDGKLFIGCNGIAASGDDVSNVQRLKCFKKKVRRTVLDSDKLLETKVSIENNGVINGNFEIERNGEKIMGSFEM